MLLTLHLVLREAAAPILLLVVPGVFRVRYLNSVQSKHSTSRGGVWLWLSASVELYERKSVGGDEWRGHGLSLNGLLDAGLVVVLVARRRCQCQWIIDRLGALPVAA